MYFYRYFTIFINVHFAAQAQNRRNFSNPAMHGDPCLIGQLFFDTT